MGRVHIVINDRHAAPGEVVEHNDWIGRLIADVKPDVVIDNGDGADMPSLSSYDKGTRSFQGRNYRHDVEAANEANDRIWSKIRKKKKKLPRRVTTIGNHEHRITRALELSPELDGAIGLKDLNLDYFYNDIVDYNGKTPGIIEIDGVYYAHYFISGVKGMPISGEHPAHALITKQNASCTAGHLHTLDFARRTGVDGGTRLGLLSGCSSYFNPAYAGVASNLWWRGVVIKRNVENGNYEPEFVTLDRLGKIYGDR